ncbi:MAG: SCP2 sterol-binding domain-containing protein [Halomonas sp.]|uniref:SCP2 sterol-binding domain-containing protein n=1 Tax=Halomonas sp. TaxID=1486246 RepID=UPI003F915461
MSDGTLDTLKARFNPDAAQGMDEVFQFHFTDKGDHHLIIKDGSLDVAEGEHDDPSVSLTMSTDVLKGLMTGDINGMTAFMTGKIKATGNVMLATQLTSLFPAG